MFCGRHTEKRDIRFFLDAPTGSTSGQTAAVPLGFGSDLLACYAIDYEQTPYGVHLYNNQTVGGSGATAGSGGAGFYSDFFGVTAQHYVTGGSALSAELIVYGCRLYMTASGTFRTAWDSVEFRAGGVLYWSTGAGVYDEPVEPSPSSATWFGGYPKITANVLVPEVPSRSSAGGYNLPDDGGGGSYSASSSARGGWQFRPSGTGAWIDGGIASASGSRSSSVGSSSATNVAAQHWEYAAPAWPKAVVRMEADTLSLVFRWNLPELRQGSTNQRTEYGAIPPPSNPPVPYPTVTGGTTYSTIQAAQTQFLQVVSDGTATIEGPLTAAVPRPYYTSNYHETLTNAPDDRVIDETADFFGGTYDYLAGVRDYDDGLWDQCVRPGQCAAYLDHRSGEFRLNNTWQHPHWSYGDAFFGNTGQWGDGPGSDDDYWLKIAQQWMRHPSLDPSDEGIDRRNFLVSSCLDQNGITGLAQQAIGCVSWWGTSVFEVDRFADFPTTFLLDQDSQTRWTFVGDGSSGATGTGSFSAPGVTIATGTTVDLALGSYTVKPFMALHRCDRLTIPAVSSGVAKVEAFLIGVDGAAVKIGETTGAATTLRIPRGPLKKSGGSWGHDMGGSAYSDTFQGAPGTDVSLSVASDPELSGCYPFVALGSGSRVRFVLHRSDPDSTGPMLLPWPTFLAAPASDAVGYADASPYRTVLFKDGPLVRYGTATHYDPFLGLINPPDGDPAMNRRRELGDAYAWVDLWGYGREWNYSALNRGPVDYEPGVEWTMIAHFWRDPFDQSRVTHSFGAQGASGPIVCRVNSYRAIPPLGYWPTRARSKASDWVDTGAYGQWTYLLAPSRRPHITVNRPTLEKPAGTDTLTNDDLTAPSGWSVRYHRLKTAGTEFYDWLATSSEKVWAKVRPYRGFVWWEGVASPPARVLGLDVSRTGRWAKGFADGGTLRVSFAPNYRVPDGFNDRDTGTPADWARVRYLRTGATDPLYALVGKDSAVSLYRLDAEDASPTKVMDIGTGNSGELLALDDGPILAWRVDGGTVSLRRFRKDETEIGTEQTTNLTGLDDGSPLAAAFYPDPRSGKRRIGLLHVIGGAQKLRLSDDGITFDS